MYMLSMRVLQKVKIVSRRVGAKCVCVWKPCVVIFVDVFIIMYILSFGELQDGVHNTFPYDDNKVYHIMKLCIRIMKG